MVILRYIEIEVPGKRKRRVPKHLTDDYYVPKKTKFMTNFSVELPEVVAPPTRHYKRVGRGRFRRSPPNPVDLPYKCDKCRAKYDAVLLHQKLLHKYNDINLE